IRHLWLLGLHTSNGDDWGYAWLDRHYFDRALTFLREWEAAHLTDQRLPREDAAGGEPARQNRQLGGAADGEQP
ncbi:MAG: hypothetical protein M3319_01135, partial [Actinomycetota bacterium]|nr:hypothetical protein [Actinomycetota bacterium]